MRILFANLAFILSFALCIPAQDSNAQIAAAVHDVLLHQQDAWNRHDLEAFMSGYWNSPDLTFFSGANANPRSSAIENGTKAKGTRWASFSFPICR